MDMGSREQNSDVVKNSRCIITIQRRRRVYVYIGGTELTRRETTVRRDGMLESGQGASSTSAMVVGLGVVGG